MKIERDDLTGSQIRQFLAQHLEDMALISPPESMHALSIEELRRPEITFWSVWSVDHSEILGCGALKELDSRHGEIKSMRTAHKHRGGVASLLLNHILEEAKNRNYERVSLETGSMKEFSPARNLYSKFGFKVCGPFSDYFEDPNSVFMTKDL